MATFSSRNRSTGVVPAPRAAIWAVLTDPDALARLTPLVKGISADGDTWCWQLGGISGLGITVSPSFLEQMSFTEGERIEFRPAAADQRAGAEGTYVLADAADGGTELAIDITITVDLPLPGLSRRAVERVMATTMAKTGDRFARNLYQALDLDPALATA